MRKTTDCISVMDFVKIKKKKSLKFQKVYNCDKNLFFYPKHADLRKNRQFRCMELEGGVLEFLDIFFGFDRHFFGNLFAFYHQIMSKLV